MILLPWYWNRVAIIHQKIGQPKIAWSALKLKSIITILREISSKADADVMQ